MSGMLDLLAAELNKVAPEKEDFIGEDGLLYCGFCKTPRQRWLEIPFRGRTERRKVHILCDCRLSAQERDREERMLFAEQSYQKALVKKCGIEEERLSRVAFPQFPQDTALVFCREWVENWLGQDRKTGKGIYLTGGVGCGKTTLLLCMLRMLVEGYRNPVVLQEIAERRREADGFKPVFYYTRTVDLINRIKAGFGNPEAEDILGLCKETPVLFLDDLGAEKPTDLVREQLYDLIDERYNARLPIHITTNLSIDRLAGVLGERIADRLREMCFQLTIDRPSFRQG